MGCTIPPILHLHDLYDSALNHLQAFLGYQKLFRFMATLFYCNYHPR